MPEAIFGVVRGRGKSWRSFITNTLSRLVYLQIWSRSSSSRAASPRFISQHFFFFFFLPNEGKKNESSPTQVKLTDGGRLNARMQPASYRLGCEVQRRRAEWSIGRSFIGCFGDGFGFGSGPGKKSLVSCCFQSNHVCVVLFSGERVSEMNWKHEHSYVLKWMRWRGSCAD